MTRILDTRVAVTVLVATVLSLVADAVLFFMNVIPHNPRDSLEAENLATLTYAIMFLMSVAIFIGNIPRGVDPYPPMSIMLSAVGLSSSAMAFTSYWMGDCHCIARLIVHVIAAIDVVLLVLAQLVGLLFRPHAIFDSMSQLARRQIAGGRALPKASRSELLLMADRLRAVADGRVGERT